MLYVALISCVVVLILSVLGVCFIKPAPVGSAKGAGFTMWELAVVIAIVFLLSAMLSPFVWLFAVPLILAMNLWIALRWRAWGFAVVGVGLLLGVFGLDLAWSWRDIVRYRELHPFVSLEERLPPVHDGQAPVLSESAQKNLERVTQYYNHSYRADALQQLHEEATKIFVRSPRFGVGRMMTPFDYLNLAYYEKEDRCQSTPFEPVKWSVSEVKDKPAPPEAMGFDRMIVGPLLEFAPPGSEGYVKSRREVAGFEPHGGKDYRKPADSPTLKVVRLDLVSLLLHETPVVYDTDSLPSMDQVKEFKTRPLDAFEEYGLGVLRGGEDLFAREDGPRVRVLGALRSAKACAKCHDGEVGQLLGAFSTRSGGERRAS